MCDTPLTTLCRHVFANAILDVVPCVRVHTAASQQPGAQHQQQQQQTTAPGNAATSSVVAQLRRDNSELKSELDRLSTVITKQQKRDTQQVIVLHCKHCGAVYYMIMYRLSNDKLRRRAAVAVCNYFHMWPYDCLQSNLITV